MTFNLDAALSYAAQGWPVLPIHGIADGRCDCPAKICSSPAKHPRTRHGLKDASTDTATVAQWFKIWPTANVAIRTGLASGLLVVDVDPRNGGMESLKSLTLPRTLIHQTGGFGWHFLYSVTESLPKKTGIFPGIDLQADGAYVVMPPSIHFSGKRYENYLNESIVSAPNWINDLLKEKKPLFVQKPALGSEIAYGSRNTTLFKAACGFMRGRCSYCGGRKCTQPVSQHLFLRLMALNSKRVNPPLDREEVKMIAENAHALVRASERKG